MIKNIINDIIRFFKRLYYYIVFKITCIGIKNEVSITDKGRYAFQYCRDILDGKDVYVEAYEDNIAEFMKEFNLTRNDAIKLLVNVEEVIDGKKITVFDFDGNVGDA